jgi:anaerobic magnesium-protoporphyrin IX monomethyl ester cyclase
MKSTKTILLAPAYEDTGLEIVSGASAPPLGLLSLSSYLERNGFPCDIIDLKNGNQSAAGLLNRFRRERCAIIGITATSISAPAALELALIVRTALPEAMLVAGGPYFTFAPMAALTGPFDLVCLFEGEEQLLELVRSQEENKPWHQIKGTMAKWRGEFYDNGLSAVVEDLTPYFPLNWNKVDLDRYSWWFRSPQNIFLVTHRGCPFSCNFCQIPFFWRTYRPPPLDALINEIRVLLAKGIRVIWFGDDNFLASPQFFSQFLAEIERQQLRFEWFFQLRADDVVRHEAQLWKARQLGAFFVLVGFESGDPEILGLLNKELAEDSGLQAAKLLHSMGYMIFGSFIIGGKGFARSEFSRALSYARKIDAEITVFSLLTEMPGTSFWPGGEPTPEQTVRSNLIRPSSGGDGLVTFRLIMTYLSYYFRTSWLRHLFRNGLRGKIVRKWACDGILSLVSFKRGLFR